MQTSLPLIEVKISTLIWVRFLYSPINLICMHILTLFISTICEKRYEISECIINVWDCAEILPSFVQSGVLFSNYSMSAVWI